MIKPIKYTINSQKISLCLSLTKCKTDFTGQDHNVIFSCVSIKNKEGHEILFVEQGIWKITSILESQDPYSKCLEVKKDLKSRRFQGEHPTFTYLCDKEKLQEIVKTHILGHPFVMMELCEASSFDDVYKNPHKYVVAYDNCYLIIAVDISKDVQKVHEKIRHELKTAFCKYDPDNENDKLAFETWNKENPNRTIVKKKAYTNEGYGNVLVDALAYPFWRKRFDKDNVGENEYWSFKNDLPRRIKEKQEQAIVLLKQELEELPKEIMELKPTLTKWDRFLGFLKKEISITKRKKVKK